MNALPLTERTLPVSLHGRGGVVAQLITLPPNFLSFLWHLFSLLDRQHRDHRVIVGLEDFKLGVREIRLFRVTSLQIHNPSYS